MNEVFPFEQVARLAAPEDNVAIAIKRLEPSLQIRFENKQMILDATVLEGHRFAIRPIKEAEPLLSWGLPFGRAITDISEGQYVANEGILEALRNRSIALTLPEQANFKDAIEPFELDELGFKPSSQVSLHQDQLYFEGYLREGGRGVGTRNTIILLGTSCLTSSFVKQLETRFKDKLAAYKHIDALVAIAHTEGGTKHLPNNYDLVLRTLAGFMVHPNVAAVLAVDVAADVINNQALESYLVKHNYPLRSVQHAFMSLENSFDADLDKAQQLVEKWLEPVNKHKRTKQSVAQLKLALQCGGSDAFSGISGNPLAAMVAKDLIQYGGSANLAETDELIGAEPYVLQRVKNLKVARKFLATLARFQARAAWHGTTAEGNPSGGNKLRGLYNIVLKSIGAANKKHPELRLDDVIDYAEPMKEAGYYFMDSPGNDLESIAGQIASGCNMIFFVTGNGSITNFPFVPTLKIVTTSERFTLLEKDMDINAGVYLDGQPMEMLAKETLELFLKVASGQKAVGEQAGQSQVQLWRNWQQKDASRLTELLNQPKPSGHPLPLYPPEQSINRQFFMFEDAKGRRSQQFALILPTSLCSGQIAQMIAQRLTDNGMGRSQGIERFVSLTHTEGCGVSGDGKVQARTLLNYLNHPFVKHAVLLEHGCEKTHNDYMRQMLKELGLSAENFGWASIQLDGGIDKVTQKVEDWFANELASSSPAAKVLSDLSALRLALHSHGASPKAAKLLAELSRAIVNAGGTVVMAENAALLKETEFTTVLSPEPPNASLAYGQYAKEKGFHIMQNPTQHWVETLTGLGATGVELVLAEATDYPLQTHPFIPVLQFAWEGKLVTDRVDATLTNAQSLREQVEILVSLIAATLSQETRPIGAEKNSDFQMTRGLLDISL